MYRGINKFREILMTRGKSTFSRQDEYGVPERTVNDLNLISFNYEILKFFFFNGNFFTSVGSKGIFIGFYFTITMVPFCESLH